MVLFSLEWTADRNRGKETYVETITKELEKAKEEARRNQERLMFVAMIHACLQTVTKLQQFPHCSGCQATLPTELLEAI
jgi:hypothetical protein